MWAVYSSSLHAIEIQPRDEKHLGVVTEGDFIIYPQNRLGNGLYRDKILLISQTDQRIIGSQPIKGTKSVVYLYQDHNDEFGLGLINGENEGIGRLKKVGAEFYEFSNNEIGYQRIFRILKGRVIPVLDNLRTATGVTLSETHAVFYHITESSSSQKMDEAENTPVFGNGRCSPDYNLFDASPTIIKAVEKDLISLVEAAVKSKIYLADSFFNIYAAGAGISPHTHLNQLDKNEYLKLGKQKFSLVYYISVGDQDCTKPGVFKLYDPEEEILPCEGMILVIPAGRRHSAVYNGKKNRIIIGINFYTL